MKSLRTLLLAGTTLAAISSTALAQSDAAPKPHHHRHVAEAGDSGRLDRLEHLVEQQAQEIQDLKSQVNQNGAQANAPVSAAQFQALQTQVAETQDAVKTAAATQASVKFNHSHLTISSPDGKYTFQPIVDVQGDWASYSKGQPLPNGGTVGKNDLKSSGENFRRASIGFQGTFAGDFGYKFLYDFGGANGDETYQGYAAPNSGATTFNTSTGAGTGPHIRYAWVSYRGFLAPFTFEVGAMPTPANLNDMTSADDLLFNERPSPSQLSRGLDGDDGRESVGFIGNGNIWQASLFLTGDTFGKAALVAPQTTYGGGQEAVVGRFAIAPWQDPDTNFNIHLGGNFGYVIHPQESTSTATPGLTTYGITFSDRPELRVNNVTFLNTGAVNATSAYSAGVEAAASYGPFLIQGENFWYGINRNNPAVGVTDPSFSGWYVEGSWVLTGDVHRYNMATASFARPSPAVSFDPLNGYWGAWEIAGRYSSTNLDYDVTSKTVADRIFGGIQNITSAGINFYPNDTLKFMFDWQYVDLKDIGALNNNGNYNTFEIRTQVTF